MLSVTVSGTIAREEVEIGDRRLPAVLGGSGLYAAIAASVFAPTYLLGRAGFDYSHDAIEEATQGRFALVLDSDSVAPSLRWRARYPPGGARATVESVTLGALAGPRTTQRDDVTGKVLLLTPENPAYQLRLLEMGRPSLVLFVANDRWLRAWPEACTELARRAHVLFASDHEFGSLIQAQRPADSISIVTSGPGGVRVYAGGDSTWIEAPRIPPSAVVDPTGAGDALAGAISGMLAQMSHGFAPLDAVTLVSSAAGVTAAKLRTHGAAEFARVVAALFPAEVQNGGSGRPRGSSSSADCASSENTH